MRFSQRELRECVGWKRTQLQTHVRELLEAEYLVAYVAPPGKRTRYALDWDGAGQDGERFYRGLSDLAAPSDTTPSGAAVKAGSRPGHGRGGSGRDRMAPNTPSGPAEGICDSKQQSSEER